MTEATNVRLDCRSKSGTRTVIHLAIGGATHIDLAVDLDEPGASRTAYTGPEPARKTIMERAYLEGLAAQDRGLDSFLSGRVGGRCRREFRRP